MAYSFQKIEYPLYIRMRIVAISMVWCENLYMRIQIVFACEYKGVHATQCI